jgi:hypothetical protein
MERKDREQLLRALEQGQLSVLTVEEAASVLRIGRGAAYAAARRWRDTQGRDGLPVLAFGRSLRVPADVLKQMLADPPTIAWNDEVA